MNNSKLAQKLVVVFSLGLVGCQSSSAPNDRRVTTVFDTVSGTVIVRNDSVGAWRAGEEWTLIEEVRIGRINDDALEYTFQTEILVPIFGANNQILVQDFAADIVNVYDWEGHFVRRFGGTGRGPGDLTMPTALALARDSLWIAEPFLGRYSVFDSTGAFGRTIPRPWVGSIRRSYPLTVLENGDILDEIIVEGSRVGFVAYHSQNMATDTLLFLQGLLRSTTLGAGVRGDAREALRRVVNRYFDQAYWTIASNQTVWSATRSRLQLVQRDAMTGDTLRVVETTHRNVPLSGADEDFIRSGLSNTAVDRNDLDLIRPVLAGIHVLDDGHVLVQAIDDSAEGVRALDVFDPAGVFLGTVRIDFELGRLAPIASRGRELLLVTTDELDIPYVVRARLVSSLENVPN